MTIEDWELPSKQTNGTVNLSEYLGRSGVNLLHAGADGVVVTDESSAGVQKFNDLSDLGVEFGRSTSTWASYLREEYNPELRGTLGLRRYDRMRNDSAVRASLETYTTPITGGTWYVDPAEETPLDKEIAEFVRWNLFEAMTYSWFSVLNEALLMLPFGFYMFEKVWQPVMYKGSPRIIMRKMASRHPLDVEEINLDQNGGPVSIDFYNAPGTPEHVNIPIEKMVVFINDFEAGNIRGRSVLRSAYKHWYFKENAYKIDAIQKERHGIGIPIVKLPLNYTPKEKTEAIEMASNFRTSEKAHAVIPFGWEVMFAKVEGNPVSSLETANHHARMIFQNVLAQAMWDSAGESVDSTSAMALFYKSTRKVANRVLDTMNQFVIPQLVRWNWDVEVYPKLRVRGLGDTAEARELSFALRNLVGAEIVQVDDRVESFARRLLDAPEHDPATFRPLSSTLDSNAENPDTPRQSNAANMQNRQGGRAGDDSSGS